ncbi:MAG TPA: DNA starvation/stationary phase protection protein [Alphaproteobacteria bacterium]|nr:DNA starvation/stationary phase protection protein [Alphaproteobacteria bacterium]
MAKSAPKNSSAQMAKHLNWIVSDTYLLTIKTHGYHWNVTGPNFHSLHLLLEGQYNELFQAVDTIAERIRALDFYAPGSAAAFHNHTAVKEAGDNPPSATAMIKDLIKTHEQVRERISEARLFANEIEDTASEDLMNQRLAAHDKIIWMLKSQAA